MSNCVMITIIICITLVIINFTDDVCKTIREVARAKYRHNVTTESEETVNEKQSETGATE